MRHFYFRLICGMIWLLAAAAGVINANVVFAALYGALGILFLYSAYTIRRDEDNKKDK